MTSNIGSQYIMESKKETGKIDDEKIMNILQHHFRPEFINRIDEIVVFHMLAREHLRTIVDIQLGYLHARLADRDMELELTDAARDQLAEAGFDPVYGARPLKRAIQNEIENPLAQKILSGGYASGDTIQVDVADGVIVVAGKAGYDAVFVFEKVDGQWAQTARLVSPSAMNQSSGSISVVTWASSPMPAQHRK